MNAERMIAEARRRKAEEYLEKSRDESWPRRYRDSVEILEAVVIGGAAIAVIHAAARFAGWLVGRM